MKRWIAQHGQALVFSLGQIVRNPLPGLLTTLVIGVALALPLMLWVMVQNLDGIGSGLQEGRQLSVFLAPSIDESTAMDVLVSLEQRPDIRRVDLVSRDAALAELDDMAWVVDVVGALGANPLPVTILVEPGETHTSPQALQTLVEELTAMAPVDQVLLDVVWLQRLEALLALIRRSCAILAVLLGIAVLLTMGNTIRLMVVNRADEILVINRVGGTDAFIRRPFVYTGVLQGLFGGLLAVALVIGVGLSLQERVEALVTAYGSNFSLAGPHWDAIGAVIVSGVVLGWIASWIAVSRHLHGLRPR